MFSMCLEMCLDQTHFQTHRTHFQTHEHILTHIAKDAFSFLQIGWDYLIIQKLLNRAKRMTIFSYDFLIWRRERNSMYVFLEYLRKRVAKIHRNTFRGRRTFANDLPARLTVDFYCRFLPAKLTSRFLLPISSRLPSLGRHRPSPLPLTMTISYSTIIAWTTYHYHHP